MDGSNFEAIVDVEVLGKHGYLSIFDWPLLQFYGILCRLYIFAGIIWLMISIMRWKDFGSLQFWIAMLLLLGILENFLFYAEFQHTNNTGLVDKKFTYTAEIFSCFKHAISW